jgi:hypothetical protein
VPPRPHRNESANSRPRKRVKDTGELTVDEVCRVVNVEDMFGFHAGVGFSTRRPVGEGRLRKGWLKTHMALGDSGAFSSFEGGLRVGARCRRGDLGELKSLEERKRGSTQPTLLVFRSRTWA